MSSSSSEVMNARGLTVQFPQGGELLQQLWYDLAVAETATNEDDMPDIASMPRPWIPATVADTAVRKELWQWLEAVAHWVNRSYGWGSLLVPKCWPAHPHIVNELATLADQRRRAEMAVSSDAIEEWHRWTLPMFCDRLRGRLGDGCFPHHKPFPAGSQWKESGNQESSDQRWEWFDADLRKGYTVDRATGEVHGDP